MTKKLISKIFLFSVMFWIAQSAMAQQWENIDRQILKQSDSLARTLSNVQREITQQERIEQATVAITFHWIKPTTVRQTAIYPSRGGIHKSEEKAVIKTKTTQCKGILLENGSVATAKVCARKKGWELEKLTLTFFDKTDLEKEADELKIIEDICYINVANLKKDNLIGLPFSPIPAGKNLWEHFGEENIGPALDSFLSSKGVIKAHYFGGKRYRMYVKSHLSRIGLGEAFIYKGHVVALVQKKVNYYYVTPEKNTFALFR